MRWLLQGGAGSNVSDYSHGTGFLNWWGWDPIVRDRTYLTDVTAAARRGATVLNVSCTSSQGLEGALSTARWMSGWISSLQLASTGQELAPSTLQQ